MKGEASQVIALAVTVASKPSRTVLAYDRANVGDD